MGIKNDESMDIRVSRTVCKAFEQLIQDIKNEPGLILEGENQPVDGENALQEIRSWLFRRRRTDGHTDNSTDK